jgi:hypothetical protein
MFSSISNLTNNTNRLTYSRCRKKVGQVRYYNRKLRMISMPVVYFKTASLFTASAAGVLSRLENFPVQQRLLALVAGFFLVSGITIFVHRAKIKEAHDIENKIDALLDEMEETLDDMDRIMDDVGDYRGFEAMLGCMEMRIRELERAYDYVCFGITPRHA